MSGTAISALPAAGSVGLTDLFAKVALGSPNVTQRATISQLFNALNGGTLQGPLSLTTQGTVGNEVVNFSQFNPQAAALGFIHLPGGVTLQWGTAATTGTITTTFVTFPVAFSGDAWSVMGMANDGVNAIVSMVGTPIATAAGFQGFRTDTGAAVATTFYWFAVGPT